MLVAGSNDSLAHGEDGAVAAVQHLHRLRARHKRLRGQLLPPKKHGARCAGIREPCAAKQADRPIGEAFAQRAVDGLGGGEEHVAQIELGR